MRDRISLDGPLSYRTLVDLALYHQEHGFYAAGGSAGRRGDFITSPEVGPLFGAVVAQMLDAEWTRLGRPSTFSMIELGAGPGTLARSVLAAQPECADALHYVAVERSAAQREFHPDGVVSSEGLPEPVVHGVLFANELLDNVAFAPVRRVDGTYRAVDVGFNVDTGELVEVLGAPVDPPTWTDDDEWFDQSNAAELITAASRVVAEGCVVFIDYAREQSTDVAVRTYQGHAPGVHPLQWLGQQDITIDVDLSQLLARLESGPTISTQADWLTSHGINELVAEGRAIWAERAGIGDLAALRARSRISEAEALLDPAGLGGFSVFEWAI